MLEDVIKDEVAPWATEWGARSTWIKRTVVKRPGCVTEGFERHTSPRKDAPHTNKASPVEGLVD